MSADSLPDLVNPIERLIRLQMRTHQLVILLLSLKQALSAAELRRAIWALHDILLNSISFRIRQNHRRVGRQSSNVFLGGLERMHAVLAGQVSVSLIPRKLRADQRLFLQDNLVRCKFLPGE